MMNLPTVSAFGRCGASESERDDGFSRRVGGRERVFRPPVVEIPTWQPRFRRSN